jgi:hypothetical protein
LICEHMFDTLTVMDPSDGPGTVHHGTASPADEPATTASKPASSRLASPADEPATALSGLGSLAEKVRPTTMARTQLIPVPEALACLFPEGGLQRGTVVSVDAGGPPGATSLAIALVSAASAQGWWVGFVGMGGLNPAALAEAGISLEKTLFCPAVSRWGKVVASMVGGIEATVARPPGKLAFSLARTLTARVLHARTVLVVLARSGEWPTQAHVSITIASSRWQGASRGHGYLAQRYMTVTAKSRGTPLPLRADVTLPWTTGVIPPLQ